MNAIFVWGVARALGGRVLLRVEDHDRIRSRPAFEASILQDLEWLGFEPDEGLVPLHRQSDHDRRYQRALEQLKICGHVYACACSRKEIGSERYPGTCRERSVEEAPGHGLRVALDPAPERFEDLLLGSIEQVPANQCGDLLLKDRDGNWTYQFAVTVDDIQERVDLVIRGEDLLASTGRQIKLGRMLGRAVPPHFLHHPLIVKDDGAKLSKASGDTGVHELRRAGVRPEAVIGRAAAAAGLTERMRSIAAPDVADLIRGVAV